MQTGTAKREPGLESLAVAIVEQAQKDRRKKGPQAGEARDFLTGLLDLVGRGDLKGRLA